MSILRTLVILIIMITLIITHIQLIWFNEPAYATAPTLKPLSSEVKAAMLRCGPNYPYKIYPNGKLIVFINGEWLNLNY